MSNQTGHYDRDEQAARLTAANTARLARDPFAAIAADPAEDAAAELSDAITGDPWRPGHGADDQAPAAVDHTGPLPADQVERVNAIIDGPAAPAPAVDLFSAEWPYPQLSAANFAALYTAAAGHIEARGYYAYEVQGYGDEPGLSITGALKLAALEHVTAADPAAKYGNQLISARELTEDLETRLSAVLYVYGQAHRRTSVDLSDVHVGWSLGHFASAASASAAARRGHGVPTREHALALLRKAAAMFTMIDGDSAPVTEAPAPARF